MIRVSDLRLIFQQGTRARTAHDAFVFAWGVAEATVFFVVPDFLITRAALGSLRKGLLAAAIALAGALVGGVISYKWGETDLASARHVLDALPAISIAMLDRAQRALVSDGMFAAFIGSFSGVPYKVFAVHAASAGIALPMFVVASIPVRGIRFVVLAALARTFARISGWSTERLYWVWALAWAVNYAIYWTVMPN